MPPVRGAKESVPGELQDGEEVSVTSLLNEEHPCSDDGSSPRTRPADQSAVTENQTIREDLRRELLEVEEEPRLTSPLRY
jgi:hypothetical protein